MANTKTSRKAGKSQKEGWRCWWCWKIDSERLTVFENIQINRQTNICHYRVTFATENNCVIYIYTCAQIKGWNFKKVTFSFYHWCVQSELSLVKHGLPEIIQIEHYGVPLWGFSIYGVKICSTHKYKIPSCGISQIDGLQAGKITFKDYHLICWEKVSFTHLLTTNKQWYS